MLTRCPHCETTFRVSAEQLKVRQGRVRCGACQSVFDAFDSLADEPIVLATPEPEPIAAPVGIQETTQETTPEAALPSVEAEPQGFPQPEPAPEPEPEPEPEPIPEAWEEAPPPPPPRRWPWAVGSVLLIFVAAAQLAYQFRVELSVMTPELRPVLQSACALIDCTVPYPSKPELIGIDASDLAPADGERLLLTASLRNRAPFTQEYPHLELTLTDTQDAALLRKVFAPSDWLPAGRNPAGGFASRDAVDVKLLLEAPGVPAVGYRLYLFYP